jgi:AcrR family transcriptional regulator
MAILDAAERLVCDEGYGALSTRRVATLAGIKPSLVHYYFPATDDLWFALFRRGAEHSDALLEQALVSPDPLRALWEFFADKRTALVLEFMALANHRKAIRVEMAEHSERMRERQAQVIARIIGDKAGISPEGLTVVLAGIGRALVMEGALGAKGGHQDARAFVEGWLARLAGAGDAQP